MEAKLYQIQVCDDGLALSHGFYHTIWEIYIPQIGAIFNSGGGAFRDSGPRIKEGEIFDIEIPYESVVAIDHFIHKHEEIEKIRGDIFKEDNLPK